MNFQEAEAYVTGSTAPGTMLGLERVKDLLARLGNPQKKIAVIHVAGTNGKGSTCVMLAAVLKEAGYHTGLFTSPYLHSVLEYLQINGELATEEEYVETFQTVMQCVKEMQEPPTEFELSVAMAFLYYTKKQCDVLVMECGLGGRLDATNVLETPLAVVITNIGIDHIGFLGNSLQGIAAEKAGIIQKNSDVVLYAQSQEVEETILEKANKEQARVFKTEWKDLISQEHSLEGQIFSYGEFKKMKLSLLGGFQIHNAAVVLECVKLLRKKGYVILEEAIRKAFLFVTWPARFEVLSKQPLIVADGGHNDQCLAFVTEGIETYFPNKKIIFLTGVMADKDYPAMYDKLAPYAAGFVAIEPENERALKREKLAAFLGRYSLPVLEGMDMKDALEKAVSQAGTEGVVFAVGSLYMMDAFRKAVKELSIL